MTNTYLLISGKAVGVIDPAFEPETILRTIEKENGELETIINTHGHIDHIEADSFLKEKTKAKVLIHKSDAPLVSQPSQNLSLLIGERLNDFSFDRLLEEGDRVKIGEAELTVLHTPGHTEGSICLLAKDFAFTGDTLFFDSIGRTDLPGGSEEKIFASLKKLSRHLKDEMMVYPGHGEFGLFKTIKEVNPFLPGRLLSK